MDARLPVTVRPVLTGLAPGVTVTVRRVVPPTLTDEGAAAPTPLGFVGVLLLRQVPERFCGSLGLIN